MDVTARLSRFVAGCRWADLPPALRREAKRSLLNYFATVFAGCREAPIEKAVRVLGPLSGDATASLVGRTERLDLLNSAFVNAMGANVFDFDDTHPATIIHPTAPVAPALFAFAETYGLAGEELLLGFVLGAEAECRIGNAISPGHYRRGWHITSTCGVFGAAIAIGKVLALDEQHLAWAIGNASAQTGGSVETLGTMSKSISVGNAAKNGLLSALLAGDDFSGPDRPLEGERGFLRLACDEPRFDVVCDGLGERWELLSNTYKPYPCGVVLNPVVEAGIELSRDRHLSIPDIEHIEIVGHPLLRERTDRPDARSGREAQVSAQHAVAVALGRGRAELADFSDEAVADPALKRIGARVQFVDDESYPVDSAQVKVLMKTGEVLQNLVMHANGGPSRPMSSEALEEKLRTLALHGGVRRDPAPLIQAVWELESISDAASVMALARSESRAAP